MYLPKSLSYFVLFFCFILLTHKGSHSDPIFNLLYFGLQIPAAHLSFNMDMNSETSIEYFYMPSRKLTPLTFIHLPLHVLHVRMQSNTNRNIHLCLAVCYAMFVRWAIVTHFTYNDWSTVLVLSSKSRNVELGLLELEFRTPSTDANP